MAKKTTKPAKAEHAPMEAWLKANGWSEVGWGRNHSSWLRPDGRSVLVFGTLPGSGPNDCHWVETSKDGETFVAGGFEAAGLVRHFAPPARFAVGDRVKFNPGYGADRLGTVTKTTPASFGNKPGQTPAGHDVCVKWDGGGETWDHEDNLTKSDEVR